MVNFNVEGMYEFIFVDFYDVSYSSDNCGVVEVMDYEVYNLDCDDVNIIFQFDVIVEDEAGNFVICQVNILVFDDVVFFDQW